MAVHRIPGETAENLEKGLEGLEKNGEKVFQVIAHGGEWLVLTAKTPRPKTETRAPKPEGETRIKR
jgi:hypothetical protein